MPTTVTNANLDTAGSAVAAGNYGPLTRVTDLQTMAIVPNSHVRVQWTNVNGNTVYISYDEIARAVTLARIMKNSEGLNAKAADIRTQLNTLNVAAQALTAPFSYSEYVTMIEGLRAFDEVEAMN